MLLISIQGFQSNLKKNVLFQNTLEAFRLEVFICLTASFAISNQSLFFLKLY